MRAGKMALTGRIILSIKGYSLSLGIQVFTTVQCESVRANEKIFVVITDETLSLDVWNNCVYFCLVASGYVHSAEI